MILRRLLLKPLKILFVSPEVAPYAKTGGLAEVSSSLPEALVSLGHQVRVVMPFYRSVEQGGFTFEAQKKSLDVPFKKRKLITQVFLTKKKSRLLFYFVKRDEFFDRKGLSGKKIYGGF